MRILGIDPGLQTTGFGVIDAHGQQLRYVASGTIRTTAAQRGDVPGRLKILFDGIAQITREYQPDQACFGDRVRQRQPATQLAARINVNCRTH